MSNNYMTVPKHILKNNALADLAKYEEMYTDTEQPDEEWRTSEYMKDPIPEHTCTYCESCFDCHICCP